MSAVARIRIEGLDELIRSLEKFPDRIKEAIRKEFRKHSLKMLAAAKRRAPVKTGLLRRSLRIEQEGPLKINFLSVYYGVYVEYGTVRMKARPFMIPSIEENLPDLVESLARKFEEVWK